MVTAALGVGGHHLVPGELVPWSPHHHGCEKKSSKFIQGITEGRTDTVCYCTSINN